jgi:beta-galactosidase
MQRLEFDHLSYRSNGERIFLISGELHYFRVPHQGWQDRLEKLKAAGGNCVATYVPWLLHEPEEGVFDFSSTHLDFERFLDLCHQVGLWAIVRPGPYQYSELIHGGLPRWLMRGHPEILAQRLDGSPIRNDLSVSYLHPVLLEKTKRWFDQVVPLLARHQVHLDGAVAAVQIDNELMGIHEWFGSWDYHPDSMGVGRGNGRWSKFLKDRYHSLETLNNSWNTRLQSWSEAYPIEKPTLGTLGEYRRLKDYNDFYFTAAAEYMTLLGNWLKDLGITVPLIHNSGGPGMNAYFEETVKQMGRGFLLGSDHYYNLGLDWGDGTHPTPKYASKVFYSLEMLRHMGMPPTVFELPGGSAMDYPPILGHDLECAYLVNLAYGMKGYNIYVFAGGENPPGAADPTVGMSNYDYGAGISPTGELRELYHVQKKVADFIHTHPWLTQARRVADCRLGLVREYARSFHYGYDQRGVPFSNTSAWTLMRKGLMMTAFNASLSPELIDMDSNEWLEDTSSPVMLAAATTLSQSIQERLVKFVRHGGKLVVAPCLPTLDQQYQPCTVLAEYLGASLSSDGPGGLTITGRPPDGKSAFFDASTGSPIAWSVELASGGEVIVLERSWIIGRRWDEQMLKGALLRLGCQPVVDCDNPNVWTSLLSDGEHCLLFLMNLLTGPLTCAVSYQHPSLGRRLDAGKHTLQGISVKIVEFEESRQS